MGFLGDLTADAHCSAEQHPTPCPLSYKGLAHGLYPFNSSVQCADQVVLDCRWYICLPSFALVLACYMMPASRCHVAPKPGLSGRCSASKVLFMLGISVTCSFAEQA